MPPLHIPRGSRVYFSLRTAQSKLNDCCSWFCVCFKAHLYHPVVGVLKAGITPSKLALSIAFGITCGLFPLPGTTIALCFVATLALGLNKIIIQVINLALTPLNVLLIPLWYRLGNLILRRDLLSFTTAEMLKHFKQDFFGTLSQFKDVIVGAIVGWGVIFPFASLLLYLIFYPLLSVIMPRLQMHNQFSQDSESVLLDQEFMMSELGDLDDTQSLGTNEDLLV
eukprot:Ihof_evm1s364 gene=Ihof_evmTU1s364